MAEAGWMWLETRRLSSHALGGLQGMRRAQWMAALPPQQRSMVTRGLRGMQMQMVTAWMAALDRAWARQRRRAMLTATVFPVQRAAT